MTDVEHLYRESQEAILGLITEDNAHDNVPACPEWNLRELLSHLTGALLDISSGNTEGAPSPTWTASHIDRFRDAQVDELAETWRKAVDTDAARSVFRHMGVGVLLDIGTHEFDVRGAVGNTDRRDAEILKAIYPVAASMVDRNLKANNLPSITLGTEVEPVIVGEGMPQASLSTSVFELSRVITGRRSPAQVRALEWSVDPSRWVDSLSMKGQRETDLVE